MDYKITKKKIYCILAFVMGLSVFENISSVFVIGSTRFVFSLVYAVFLFIVLFFFDIKRMVSIFKAIPKSLLLFVIICIVSIMPGIVYFGSVSIIVRYLMGLISLILVILAVFDVIFLSEYRRFIVYGLFVGLLLNALISLFAYLSYKRGQVFTLQGFFPNTENFYVPMYSFRAQGFFLEPSHYLRFFITSFIIVCWYYLTNAKKRGKILFFTLTFLEIPVLMLSGSGSVVIVFLMVFGFLILSDKRIRRMVLPALVIISVLLIVVLIFNPSIFEMYSGYIADIFSGGNITSDDNKVRLDSMKVYLDYALSYPFGIGFNQTGTLGIRDNVVTTAAYSEYIEIFLETGLFGIVTYVFSMCLIILKLIKNKTNYSIALAITLVGICVLQVGTDYFADVSFAIVIGLSISYIKQKEVRRVQNGKKDFVYNDKCVSFLQ